jgi:cytochrome bd-type quinol oxidase subunit 2
MFKNIRKSIVSLLAAATLVAVPIAVPVAAFAAKATSTAPSIQDSLCQGTTLTVDNNQSCDTNTSGGKDHVNNIIKTVINIFSIVVGVVSVIMIIVGGFRYITSGGDSNNVSGAKNTIIYAIIGLIVVALAQFIVQFVLNKVTSNNGS